MAAIVTIRESLFRIKPDDVRAREWNAAVRAGLIKAADWLINTNLRKRKFSPTEQRRYDMRPRSVRYIKKKMFAKLIRDPETRLKVQPAKPTANLVYTGRLRDFIMGREPSQYRKIATSTSSRVRLRVPIQVPGRAGGYMKAEQYEELSRWTPEEYVEMRRIIVAEVSSILGFGGGRTEEQLWRAAD